MSWKIAILVALCSGLVTAVTTFPVADKMTRLFKVSDFEGKRGMAVVFLFVPAGLLGGLLFGLLGAHLMHAVLWTQFWKAVGLSLLMSHGALFGISGMLWLTIDRPPLLDGHRLALEIDVTAPLKYFPEGRVEPEKVTMSLYGGKNDNRSATVDTAHIRIKDGSVSVRAEVHLLSKSAFRMLSFYVDSNTGFAIDPLPLPPKPRIKDLEWTKLMRMRDAKVIGTAYTYTDVLIRYRVVKKEKDEN